MNEVSLQMLSLGKSLWIVVGAFLYALGGMKGKYKRRVLMPLWLGTGVVISSLIEGYFSGWLFLYPPLLFGALSMGYGADKTKDKIARRAIYGFLVALASVPVAYVTGNWLLFGLHIFLCTLVSIALGVWNPTSAREEETLIGIYSGLLPLFM